MRARQQLRAEMLLERLDLHGERGLNDVQPRGCTAENYKESYLRRFHPGQEAWVWLDTRPWHLYRARIQGIARGFGRMPAAIVRERHHNAIYERMAHRTLGCLLGSCTARSPASACSAMTCRPRC